MAVAVLLILVGIGLIVTGNNNSLLGKKDKKENNEEQEQQKRSVVPVDLTTEEAVQLLVDEKANKYAEEAWTLGEVRVLARGENGTFLVLFDKVYETNTETLQTVIAYGENGWVVDLTGWPEGSKYLSEYNFKYFDVEPAEEPVEEPAEEPVVDSIEEPVIVPSVEPPVSEPEAPAETPAADAVEPATGE